MELKKFQLIFTKELEKRFVKIKNRFIKINTNKDLLPIFEHIVRLSKNGKNIRPFLCFSIINKNGDKKIKDFISLLLGIEILHIFALVHDDIIDKAQKRRGEETIHSIANQKNRHLRYSDDHYGNSQAIIIGDIILNEAWSLVTEFDAKNNTNISKFFKEMIDYLAYGQMLDISIGARHFNQVSTKEILEIMFFKTAQYSIYYPILFGYSALKEKTPSAVKDFSKNIGLSFQAQDDLLDIFGEEKKVGKSLKKDITEGKHTIFTSFLNETNDKKSLSFLESVWRKSIDKKQNQEWQEILLKSGAKINADIFIKQGYEQSKKQCSKIWRGTLAEKNILDLITKLEKRTN